MAKNQAQQGLPMPRTPKLIYRGLPMACVNMGGTTAIQFWLTGFFQSLLARGEKPTTQSQLTGAFLGGLTSGVPNSFYELVMIQQQNGRPGGLFGVPIGLVKEFGVSSLMRGCVMTMGRESLFTMNMLGVTPLIQSTLVEHAGVEKNSALVIGALTGSFVGATLTHPMDTIK